MTEIDELYRDKDKSKIHENKFYEFILGKFYRSFSHRGFSQTDCDDLISISSEKIIRLVARYDGTGTFAGYFYTRFDFLVIDSIRKFLGRGGRHEEISDDEALEKLSVDDFSELIIENDSLAPIITAIAELKLRQQQIIELIYFRRLKVSQISQVWGVSRQAVFTLHRRAINGIAKKIDGKFTK